MTSRPIACPIRPRRILILDELPPPHTATGPHVSPETRLQLSLVFPFPAPDLNAGSDCDRSSLARVYMCRARARLYAHGGEE